LLENAKKRQQAGLDLSPVKTGGLHLLGEVMEKTGGEKGDLTFARPGRNLQRKFEELNPRRMSAPPLNDCSPARRG